MDISVNKIAEIKKPSRQSLKRAMMRFNASYYLDAQALDEIYGVFLLELSKKMGRSVTEIDAEYQRRGEVLEKEMQKKLSLMESYVWGTFISHAIGRQPSYETKCIFESQVSLALFDLFFSVSLENRLYPMHNDLKWKRLLAVLSDTIGENMEAHDRGGLRDMLWDALKPHLYEYCDMREKVAKDSLDFLCNKALPNNKHLIKQQKFA